MKKKLSILIPCYNVEKYIKQCLDSVVSQLYSNTEIICINDGSQDGTLKILNEYASNDSRIIVIDKNNSGYGDSMNFGLSIAKGEYIGIVESDDFVELDMFSELMGIAIRDDLDIARCCYYQYITKSNSNTLVNNDFVLKNVVINPSKDSNPFYQAPSIWAAIYRKKFLDENNIKFLPTPGASYQDTSFAFKCYACAKRFEMLDKAYLHYRIDSEGSSVNSPSKIFCVCDEYSEMWRFAESRENKEFLYKILPILKLATYKWNYNRLASKLQWQFLKKWSCEMRQEFRDGRVFKNDFKRRDYRLMWMIAHVPFLLKWRKHV